LPQLTPSFFLGELEIDDVRGDQLEGIIYRAKDYGMTQFEINSRGVTVAVD
jgi:hypothetical protein